MPETVNTGSKELIASDSDGEELIQGTPPNEEDQLFGSMSNFGHMDEDRTLSLRHMACCEDVKFSVEQKPITDPGNQGSVNLDSQIEDRSLNNSDSVQNINSEANHSHSKNLNGQVDSSGAQFQHSSQALRFLGKQRPESTNRANKCGFQEFAQYAICMVIDTVLASRYGLLSQCSTRKNLAVPQGYDDTEKFLMVIVVQLLLPREWTVNTPNYLGRCTLRAQRFSM